MIRREDMLELTRRMTLSRTSFTRIAGCYVDRDGEFDGSFNTNFLKLMGSLTAASIANKCKSEEIRIYPKHAQTRQYVAAADGHE